MCARRVWSWRKGEDPYCESKHSKGLCWAPQSWAPAPPPGALTLAPGSWPPWPRAVCAGLARQVWVQECPALRFHPGCRRPGGAPRRALPGTEVGPPPLLAGLFSACPRSPRRPLSRPLVGPALVSHRPRMSFTARQFPDSVTLFVMLYFTAGAFGKWVLNLGTACLNSRPRLAHE